MLCRDGRIEVHHLPPDITPGAGRERIDPRHKMNLRIVERSLIQEALARHQGNRALAARELGIDPSTLYRKIKRLGIDKPERDGRARRS